MAGCKRFGSLPATGRIEIPALPVAGHVAAGVSCRGSGGPFDGLSLLRCLFVLFCSLALFVHWLKGGHRNTLLNSVCFCLRTKSHRDPQKRNPGGKHALDKVAMWLSGCKSATRFHLRWTCSHKVDRWLKKQRGGTDHLRKGAGVTLSELLVPWVPKLRYYP